MQGEKQEGIGCKCSVQRRCAVAGKDCTMKALYCKECEGRLERRKIVDSEIAPSTIEKTGARGESDLAEERGEAATKRNSCTHECCGQLHLTPCD